jgi:thiamine-monophosphate kinase
MGRHTGGRLPPALAMTDPIGLGPGSEFDLIRKFLEQDARIRGAKSSPDEPGAAASARHTVVGPGGDCAVVTGRAIAISVDASIEDVHFRREWMTPRQIGYRAAAAALSDLAPVAAVPIGVFVTLGLRGADVPGFAMEVMAGVSEAADACGAALLGGDVARSAGRSTIGLTVAGEVEKAVSRAGARPGDEVWVTGTLGAPGLTVRAWNAGRTPPPGAQAAFVRPRPRIQEARWLAGRDLMTAAIDLSDGLAGDTRHLAAASHVRILLDEGAIPIAPAVLEYDDAEADPLWLALGGGEDYELCFTAPAGAVERERPAFARQFDVRLTQVGTVVEGDGVRIVGADGNPRELEISGYNHFAMD